MRNKEQHEGKGKGLWACSNHNMCNLIIKTYRDSYACYDCCMPLRLPSLNEKQCLEHTYTMTNIQSMLIMSLVQHPLCGGRLHCMMI